MKLTKLNSGLYAYGDFTIVASDNRRSWSAFHNDKNQRPEGWQASHNGSKLSGVISSIKRRVNLNIG